MLKKTLIALAIASGLAVIGSVLFKVVFEND